jgi:L-malate glycosyltransferase
MSQMKRVLIIQSQIKQYRVPFFEALHRALAQEGVALRVAYSDPSRREAAKSDNRDLPADLGVKVKGTWMCSDKIFFQSLLKEVMAADFVIMEQANKYIWTHLLLALSILRLKKVAFWGHGRNRQARQRGLSESLKALSLNRVVWWFAYTQTVGDYLVQLGFPRERITVVENAIDTLDLVEAAQKVTPGQLDRLRQDLNVNGGPVGIYCGAMYPDKRMDFLTQACDRIRELVPGFEMLFVGAGSDASIVERFVESRPWAHYVGRRYGADRVPYFLLSDVLLMPGAVGLAVLDCFALGTPLLTTKFSYHGPEIDYLESGVDGIVSEDSLEAYIAAVVEVLRSEELQQRLKRGCWQKSRRYTTKNMVDRFSHGIFDALEAK